jgi:acylphosphatase
VSDAVVRRRLVVHGRVQGVWYRDSARRMAERHGVAGRAANLPDGTVELILEGEPAAVASVEAWAARGPRQAEVTGVEGTDEDPRGLAGFDIT